MSQVTPKPLYENEHATAFWDVPLFADTTQVKGNRIEATVIDNTSKQVEPWLSQVTPKPLYENEHATAFWDVPLFADTTQVKANRIDATVIDKTSKQVRVIEMSCPWLENRESKDFEKTTKYSQLRLELTNRYLQYKVNQYNIIIDVLGGCAKEVEQNIKELVGDKCESVMRQMQKAILSSSLHFVRMFTLSAQISIGILDTHYRNFIYIP